METDRVFKLAIMEDAGRRLQVITEAVAEALAEEYKLLTLRWYAPEGLRERIGKN